MKVLFRAAFWLSLSLLAAGSLLSAQNPTGTITGQVKDTTGAVLPGVEVTVENLQTGQKRQVVTSDTGEYRVTLLPVGNYRVSASLVGFATAAATNLELNVQETLRADLVLQVGDVTQTIEVTSDIAQLQTESSTTGHVIKQDQVTNLPLNVRQWLNLTFLTPFATPATRDIRSSVNFGARDSSAPSTGGQRPEDNNYQLDGFDNQESSRHNYALTPPVDSIGEFKVIVGTAPAEFGRSSGTVINAVSKSGTNTFHGGVYEFFRNNALDARPFFDRTGETSPLKRNQFGASLGGPIVRDKLFFFANYEGFRQRRSGNPVVGRVPTEEERSGLISTAIIDPLTGQEFPKVGDKWQIPASRIDPISQKILECCWPTPTDPTGPVNRNFNFARPATPLDRDWVTVRGDYTISPSDNMYVRYVINDDSINTPPTFPNGAGGTDFSLKGWTLGGHYNHIFNPILVNNFGVAYTRFENVRLSLLSNGTNYHELTGITNVLADVDPTFTGTPNIGIPGYLGPGEATPNYSTMNNYQVFDNVSWQRGAHGIKFGADFRIIDTNMFYTGGNGGHSFANRYSRDNFADFLLGLPSSVSKTARATIWDSRLTYLGAYIQDDWKVSQRLTINIGLRYEIESPIDVPRNDTLGFDGNTGEMLISENIADRAAIEAFYRDVRPDIAIRFVPHDTAYDADVNNFAPRLGLAYRLFSRTVVRAGFGISYSAPQAPSLASTSDFAPNSLRPIWTGASTRPFFVLPNGGEIPAGYNPEGAGGPEFTVAFPTPLTIFPFYERSFPYGYNQQWMMSLQHQFGNNMVAEAQYLGSRAVHLLGFHNTNYVTDPQPGAVQPRLPFPSFARIQGQHMGLDSWYHGLGLKFEQRPANGLSYLVSYTWSHSLDTGSTLNQSPQFGDPTRLWESAKGNSDYDVRHRLVAGWTYELPFGRGRRWGDTASGVLSQIIGGWGFHGIATFQTGFWYTPGMNLARANFCATACTARPDRLADGNLPSDQQTLEQYWNRSAFVLPELSAPRIGNAGRNILEGPGINNWDLSFFKNFRLSEGVDLHFRYEMFNAFNHTQWAAPSSSVESSNFGVITGTYDPRISQVVLRVDF